VQNDHLTLAWDTRRNQLDQVEFRYAHPETQADPVTLRIRPEPGAWDRLRQGWADDREAPEGAPPFREVASALLPLARALTGRDLEEIEPLAAWMDLASGALPAVVSRLRPPSGERFHLPLEIIWEVPDLVRARHLAPAWFHTADALFPEETWIWELARELFFVAVRRPGHLDVTLDRVAASPDLGGVGCLLVEQVLAILGHARADEFRALARRRFDDDGFDRDARLFARLAGDLGDVAHHLLLGIRESDDEDLRFLSRVFGPRVEGPLAQALESLRSGPVPDGRDDGPRHVRAVWDRVMDDRLRTWEAEEAAARLRTPMHRAIYTGDLEALRNLLDEGLSPEAFDDQGQPLLSLAAEAGRMDVAGMLLEAGAEIGATDRVRSLTALHAAARRGDAAMVRFLLEAEADPNASGTPQRITPLSLAAEHGHLEVVQLLLDAGPGPERQAASPSALHMAARHGHVEVVRALLRAGVNPNVHFWSELPIHLAAFHGHAAVVAELLAAGAEFETSGRAGLPPMILAKELRHTAVVELLQAAIEKKEASR